MNHIPYENWLLYINNELEPKVCESYDEHLYQCDQCLAQYMEALEYEIDTIPSLTDEDQFVDQIMEQINKPSTEAPTKQYQTSFHRKTIVHYVIAAGMTLFLMFSGVFSNLTDIIGTVEQQKQHTSIVKEIMDHSISIIDSFEKNFKEGD